MKRTIITIVAGLALTAAVVVQPVLADAVTSLRGESGLTDNAAAPDLFKVNESGPVERAFRQQPPLVPHRIDKYEIDLKVNQCLRCHDWPNNVKENAPKVSETHYQNRAGERLDYVAGTRWFCNQCHVPQADAKPLVENVFEPAVLGR